MAIGCFASEPSVRLVPAKAPELTAPVPTNIHERAFYKHRGAWPIYADAHYRFDYVLTTNEAAVFVAKTDRNPQGEQWKRITEVSLKNAKLGHSDALVSVYWDFSQSYRGKEYAPMPLRTGSDGVSGYPIFPDKIEFDREREVYSVWFGTKDVRDPTSPTKLEIRKKDLDEAFKQK